MIKIAMHDLVGGDLYSGTRSQCGNPEKSTLTLDGTTPKSHQQTQEGRGGARAEIIITDFLTNYIKCPSLLNEFVRNFALFSATTRPKK